MRRQASLAASAAGLAAACGLLAGAAEAAGPVSAEVGAVTFRMVTVEHDAGMRPVPPPKELTAGVSAKIDARRKELEQAFRKAHAEEWASAEADYARFRKLPAEQRSAPAGKALPARREALRGRERAFVYADPQMQRLQAESQRLSRSNWKTIDHPAPVVTLRNELIEVKVVPTLGMRVLNAVNLKTNTSFAGTADPRHYERAPLHDVRGWTAGYVEPSFPAFEHGMGVRQPAGFRVIRGGDGSATIAMNMRFTQNQQAYQLARYGRYSQRVLSGWVTLRPGEAAYSVTYRVDNPNPLRRSHRLWVNVLMEAEEYDRLHILYPAGYVTGHGCGGFEAFAAPGGSRRAAGVSHFAVYTDYGFCGVYSTKRDTNSLVYGDAAADAPGMKLYTPGGAGGFLELWRGTNPVFEHSGHFLPPYVPTSITLRFWNVSGIGRVEYADGEVALAAAAGRFGAAAVRDAHAEITDGKGAVLAAGPIGPHTPLKGRFAGRLVVKLDGKPAADVTLPLAHSPRRTQYERLREEMRSKFRPELEETAGCHGTTSPQAAVGIARRMIQAAKVDDAELALSTAAAAYRVGHLAVAADLLKLVGHHPDADYLRGLIAAERGEKVDFGRAGIDSYYLRALLELRKGDTKAAVAWLDKLIKARPTVFRAALCRAYLARDAAAAGALAATNPASPEAQLVLELLGVDGAAAARRDLLKDNPDAAEHVARFRDEITQGAWKHMRRYEHLLPKPAGP